MSKLVTLLLSIAISHCIMAPRSVAQSQTNLIVPGTRIGKMVLGANGAAILKKFGRPDLLDAGMSQTRQVWLGKGSSKASLFIHTTANGVIDAKPMAGVTIDVIRTSSTEFHTASGISVGSTLAQVKRSYPLIHRSVRERQSVIFCDRRHGIAFEFTLNKQNARCRAITVFLPGHGFLPTYHEISSLIQTSRR